MLIYLQNNLTAIFQQMLQWFSPFMVQGGGTRRFDWTESFAPDFGDLNSVGLEASDSFARDTPRPCCGPRCHERFFLSRYFLSISMPGLKVSPRSFRPALRDVPAGNSAPILSPGVSRCPGWKIRPDFFARPFGMSRLEIPPLTSSPCASRCPGWKLRHYC